VDKIFNIFNHSAFSLVFPLVDKVLFEDTLTLAYQPHSESIPLECVSAKSCVLAFVSNIYLYQRREVEIPYLAGNACAIKARRLLSPTLEEASLTNLQAVFMLVSLGLALFYSSESRSLLFTAATS